MKIGPRFQLTHKKSKKETKTDSRSKTEKFADGAEKFVASHGKIMGAVTGTLLGVKSAIGLAGLAAATLPAAAALPALAVAGTVGLGLAVAGGITGYKMAPSAVKEVFRQSENIAQKLRLPKSVGKLVASAGWVGITATLGGVMAPISTSAAGVTAIGVGLCGLLEVMGK